MTARPGDITTHERHHVTRRCVTIGAAAFALGVLLGGIAGTNSYLVHTKRQVYPTPPAMIAACRLPAEVGAMTVFAVLEDGRLTCWRWR